VGIFFQGAPKIMLVKKNVSRIRKKTFYLQFCMGTPEGNEFVGSTLNPKKIIGTSNQPIRTKNVPQKSMFSTLKV
jgi:hypothetical protein